MTSRKEDELDLQAMSIAHQIKRSDNLRVPRNPEQAKQLCKLFTSKPRQKRQDGAA